MNSAREAGRRVLRSPALLAGALVAVCVEVALLVAGLMVAGEQGDLVRPVVLAATLVPVAGARLLVAPLSVLVDDGERTRARLETRLLAVAVERAGVAVAAVVGALVGGTLLFAASTVVGYALYAAGTPAYQPAVAVTLAAVAVLAVAGLVAGAPVRLGAALAAEPRAGPAVGLRFVRDEPRTGVALAALPLVPFVVALAVGGAGWVLTGSVEGAAAYVAVVAGVVTAVLAVAVGVAWRASIRDRVGPVAAPDRSAALPSARTVVAVVVVLALVAGASGGARVTETRPAVADTYPVGEEPDAAAVVANADRAASTVNHRANATATRYEPGSGDRSRSSMASRADYADHQFAVAVRSDELRTETFVGGGTLASRRDGDGYAAAYAARFGRFGRVEGEWGVVALPAWRVGGDRGTLPVPRGETEWRVLRRTPSTVVVGVEEPAAVRRAFGYDEDYEVAPDSHVRVVVDRRTGYPRRVERARNVTRPDGERRHFRRTVRFREWRTHDLRRPRPLRDPSALELFWDALEY